MAVDVDVDVDVDMGYGDSQAYHNNLVGSGCQAR